MVALPSGQTGTAQKRDGKLTTLRSVTDVLPKRRTRFSHWTSSVSSRTKIARVAGYPSKLMKVIGDPRSRAGTFYDSLHQLATRYGPASTLTAHEFRVFSQNGEDGVVAEIVSRIGPSFPETFGEVGGGNGLAGNTLFLADVLGWQGLFIEASDGDFAKLRSKYSQNPRVATIKSFVTPVNVDQLLAEGGLSQEIGVLSIDIDGNDFYVWQALSARPVLVIVEYNGALPLDEELVQPLSDQPWSGTDYFGASLGALESLAHRLGYLLVHTELTGTNAFFVRNDYAARFSDLSPQRRIVNHELLWLSHRPDRTGRRYVRLEDRRLGGLG